MGMSVRDRIKFNKRRFDVRHYLSVKNAVIVTSISILCFLFISVIGGIMLSKKVARSTIVYKSENILENEVLNDENKDFNNQDQLVKENENIPVINNEVPDKKLDINDSVTLTILGEIMMGGEITKNVNYMYSSAFKNIYTDTNKSDFTYANLSTNITNLEKIEDAKSKYLVNKEIFGALRALGIDSVSIASDHIIDYPSDVIKNTVKKLDENNIFVAGRQNTPVYFEKHDKKISIVSTNSVILGTSKNYTKEDISIYTKDNLAKNIKEAKESADIVIADIHWGREYVYGVTDQMRSIAMSAIDAGADMVIGTHAAGVYPIVKYKDKPIIYSTGYLISDSDLNVSKESFIFELIVSKDKKIESLVMTPIYINNKKEVLKYIDFDKEKAGNYLNQFNKWNVQNSLDSTIENDRIVLKF